MNQETRQKANHQKLIPDTQYPKARLQYISQGNTPQEHLRNIGEVCEAGGRWIQLRLKEVTDAVYLHAAKQCREICNQYGAMFIVNDNVAIAKEAKADGIHLGITDMNPREARKIVGEQMIIGGTANTLEECIQHHKDGVNYIGLGPFRQTTTKKKLSPILGIAGYTEILNSEFRIQNSALPIIAIGGITIHDIPEIVHTGIDGIAVSGLLTHQEDLEEKIKTIQTTFSELSANR